MTSTLLLVADGSAARFFSAETPTSDLHELETLDHPEGRLHQQDLVSDLPGSDTRKGIGGHAYQVQTEPKRQELINFSKRIARHIDSINNKARLKNLVIVSAPEFLGLLRTQLSNQACKLIRFELNKNLIKQNLPAIRKHLPRNLSHNHL